MALPTDLEIKSYLRLDTDEEDLLIFALNQTAQGIVSRYLRVPLASESRTFTGRYPVIGPRRERWERLTIPVLPCDTSATITDVDGTTISSATYTIDPRTGTVDIARLAAWDNPPYTITVSVGWTFDPNYDTDVDPVLRQAIIDIAADLWNRRNPGATFEQSGGQVSVQYEQNAGGATTIDIPLRTRFLLDTLRPQRWLAA